MDATDRWHGRLFFGPGRLQYAGAVAATSLHSHHTFQLVLASGAPLRLRDERGDESSGHVALIPPGAEHAVVGSAPSVILLHVAAEVAAGRRLRTLDIPSDSARAWTRAGARLKPWVPERLPRRWSEAEALARTVLGALEADIPLPPPTHPAIQRLLRVLPESLEEDVRLATLARRVGLSPGRLSHLFAAQVGTPLRPYVLWLRMARVAEHLSRGVSLTEAAHAAGFSDSAHLSHVFRRMFGMAPSSLAGLVEWVVPSRP
ncbi:AraC family transcriptional regulator [Corallococcus sp. M34]|nr:AraC family transcriptional regulator [Citreicoccus inhibens]